MHKKTKKKEQSGHKATKQTQNQGDNKSFFEKIFDKISSGIQFVSYDIWRITEREVNGIKSFYIKTIKTIILALRGFLENSLTSKASALTYNTILSIVPLLAVLLGIAKGFGFQGIVQEELFRFFPGHELELNKAIGYVDGYLMQAKGGVFVGVGLFILLFTVITLISNIEDTFNNIWQITNSRAWYRKISDYLAMSLLAPLFVIASGGISIFMSTIKNTYLSDLVLITPLVENLLNLAPFVIISFMFTFLYWVLPNTKVKFLNALIAGVISGIAFQIFQILYISGQIWVSKYNAIYGSFAAIPLLLLWLHLSWIILLFGAQLSFAMQNVKRFSFERDSNNISRRYKDFLTLLITSRIIKAFAEDKRPYNIDRLSDELQIPIRLTTRIIKQLCDLNIILPINIDNDDLIDYYIPAKDINSMTVSYLLDLIDVSGSEDFKINEKDKYGVEWEAILNSRDALNSATRDTLIKDL